MNLSQFDYNFPEELVAQHPLPERAASKMMLLKRKTGKWQHENFADLPNYLNAGDVLVLNDTRVVHARIFGSLSGGKPVELLLVEKIKGSSGCEQWRCFTKRVRNYRKGDKFFFGISVTASVVGRDGDFLVVEFETGHRERAIERCGVPPLPPYIRRKNFEDYSEEDRERYQTIYAHEMGSAAAPTAGLHFTDEMLKKTEAGGVKIARITLHVGADTFAPVREEDISHHKIHGETFSISEETTKEINTAKKEGRRVIAVGTTTVRALESAACPFALSPPARRRVGGGSKGKKTHLFITPGYKFKIVDAMITNFHQPKSTLIILVSAFAGRELILTAYADAIKHKYRLFSYGDCMLIV